MESLEFHQFYCSILEQLTNIQGVPDTIKFPGRWHSPRGARHNKIFQDY